ncbi:MAG: nucleotidyl transferase AbiEii/AbiGii toxin family protein [Microgenomates group bacterium]
MGKTILTPSQSFFLRAFSKQKELSKNFFLTGGTALAEFYLKHRYSEDLDFFSEIGIDFPLIDIFMRQVAKKLKAQIEEKRRTGFIRYILMGEFGQLKIDFVHSVFSQLNQPIKKGKIFVADLEDILVDKLYTIFGRSIARDFVDLYFGMKELEIDLKELIALVEKKYEPVFDYVSYISRIMRFKDLKDYPKMIVPFDPRQMEEFFLKQVKKLEGLIFE